MKFYNEMETQLLMLASKMLDLASYEFDNHGCNDLSDEVVNLITNKSELLTGMKKWNGDPDGEWPEDVNFIGDSSLMSYLARYLEDMALRQNKRNQ